MVGVRVMARAQARALVRAAALAELVVLLHLALLEETHGAEARDLWWVHALSRLCLAKGAAKRAGRETAVARDGAGVGRWYVGATAVPGACSDSLKSQLLSGRRVHCERVRTVGRPTAQRAV